MMKSKKTNTTIKYDYILTSNGFDFIPVRIELTELKNILVNTMSLKNVLKSFILKFKSSYDYILINCITSLNIFTVNALTDSNEVITPVQSKCFSAKRIELLLKIV